MPLFDSLQSPANWLPLADAAIKATLLLAVAAAVSAALRKSSAAARHLVWTCAMLAVLALPLLSLSLPRWEIPLLTVPGSAAAAGTEMPPAVESSSRMAGEMASRIGPQPPVPPADRISGSSATSAGPISWRGLFVSIWIAGTLLLLGRLVLGVGAVLRMSRRTRVVTDAPWLGLARELASDLGLSRVTFRRSERPSMPMAWGVFRPSVLLPADADSWPHDRIRIVLLHELAHIRRADCLTHMLAQAVCALYWINPLAWVAARKLRMERERACDDLVLTFGTAGPDYADQLLAIARTLGSNRLSPAVAGASLAMARRSQLEGRLMSILDPSVPRTGVSRVRTAAAIGVAALMLVPLASVQTWVHAAPAVVPPFPTRRAPSPAPPPQPTPRETADPAVTQGPQEGMRVLPETAQPRMEETQSQNPAPVSNPDPDPDADDQSSKADPKVVAALTAALKDTDKEVRESAMHALVRLRDPGIFEPLVQALRDESADVRESAATGLGQLRDRRAVAPLSAAAKDASASVREQVVFALGQLRDPAAVDVLTGALRDESANVREQAAFALGQLRDERAVQPLMSVLKDANASVREQAVFALGQLKARSAVDGLIAAMQDADASVREQAAFALGQIRDPRAIDALSAALKDASAQVRQQAAFALGQLAR